MRKKVITILIILVTITLSLGFIGIFSNNNKPNDNSNTNNDTVKVDKNKVLFKAYLTLGDNEEYTLVFKNVNSNVQEDSWNVHTNLIIDDSYEPYPWSDDERSDKITRAVIADEITLVDTSYLFYNLVNLKEIIGLEKINTNDLNKMAGMFLNCSSLKEIDLSNFTTQKVINMSSLFYNCTSLEKVYVNPERWNTSSVNVSYGMFYNCNSLKGENNTSYDRQYIEKEYARIDTDNNPGYFTSKN